jgi:hypothetical protein
MKKENHGPLRILFEIPGEIEPNRKIPAILKLAVGQCLGALQENPFSLIQELNRFRHIFDRD